MRLVALAVGLDPRPVLQMLVDDTALLRAHRVHLHRPADPERLLGGAVGAGGERLATTLAVAGRVDDDALSLAHSAKRRLVAEQLKGVDRLPATADQEPVIVIALDHGLDPLLVLVDVDFAVEVELVEDPLDHLPDALPRLRRPLPVTHAASLFLAWRGGISAWVAPSFYRAASSASRPGAAGRGPPRGASAPQGWWHQFRDRTRAADV